MEGVEEVGPRAHCQVSLAPNLAAVQGWAPLLLFLVEGVQ